MTIGIMAAGFCVCHLTVPIAAHHSWTADYDLTKPFTLKGVVAKIEWTNPHALLHIDSTDAKGTVTRWTFQIASILQLEQGGWSRDTVKVGDRVTVDGFQGRRGRVEMTNSVANLVVLANGRRFRFNPPRD